MPPIAIERAAHCIGFTVLAGVLILVELQLGGIRHWATGMESAMAESGQTVKQGFVLRALRRLVGLNSHGLLVLLAIATAYAVLEGAEAIGLWRERRWAEYLTAVATAGFLPLEIHELAARVTAFRVIALVVNVAILLWLLWNKHLFGLRGGRSTLGSRADWDDILRHPTPARAAHSGEESFRPANARPPTTS